MKHGTKVFAFKKILELILTLLIVTIISFILIRISPIDPAEAYARRSAFAITEGTIEKLREEMGLNQPFIVQYFDWVKGAIKLDFGTSYVNGRDVFTDVSNGFFITASIVLIASFLQALGSLVVGSICYLMRNKWLSKLLDLICIAGISIPAFFFASSFIDIFAVKFRWLNVAGNEGFMRFFPAALCLSISGIAFFGQLLSSAIQRAMNEDSAIYCRCRGLSETRILVFHALSKAVSSLIPNFMQMMGLCMAGSMIVERIFSLPGLGYLIIDSVLYRDSPVIHATILVLAFSLVLFNILADIFKRAFDGHTNEVATR